MGYVCVFALSVKCEASHNNIVKVYFFLYSKSWYGARRDCNNVETVSSAKKKEAVCRILRFWLIMKIKGPFLVSVLF